MKTLLLTICICTSLSSIAQYPPVQWVNKMVGSNSKSIALDASGNVYLMGNMGAGSTLDVDPGPGVYMLNGDDGTQIIYKLNTAGQLIWAKQLPYSVTMECIRVDAIGNVYATGYFVLTTDFDPGPAVFNLTPPGGQNDAFVLKLDMAGNFLWAKNQGGSQGEIAHSMAIGSNGVVYTVGYFSGTADFDPGPGVFNLTSGILTDTYISALDANGVFLWATHISGGTNQAHFITLNALGEVYIAGQFSGTKDLDPGGGVYNLTSAGGSDIYILKLDGLGNFIWARSVGGIGTDANESVAIDPAGNVYVGGSFGFTADFDPGPGIYNFTASGSTDIFVLKLTANGGFVWAKQMSGPLAESGRNIATDAAGNVYTTGIFQDVVDFDPGPATYNLTTQGNNDIFISKFDTDGNLNWAAGFGEVTSDDRGNAIAVDALGNIYTTGNFDGQVDFDPGPGTAILLTQVTAIFVHKFGPGSVLPLSLVSFSATENDNNVLLQWQTSQEVNTKYFEVEWSTNGQQYSHLNTVAAAGSSAQVLSYSYRHVQPANGINYYRLKMIDKDDRFTYSFIVAVTVDNYQPVVRIYPNPVSDILHIDLPAKRDETMLCILTDAGGRTVASRSFTLVKGMNRLSWNLLNIAHGNYFIVAADKRFDAIKIKRE